MRRTKRTMVWMLALSLFVQSFFLQVGVLAQDAGESGISAEGVLQSANIGEKGSNTNEFGSSSDEEAMTDESENRAAENSSASESDSLGQLLYFEDFSDVPDGELPAGWQTYPGVRGTAGTWEVLDGKLVGDFSKGKGGKIVFGEPDLRNYILSADVTFEEFDDLNRWVGLMFRVAPDHPAMDYHYHFAVRPKGEYEQHQRDAKWVSGKKFVGQTTPFSTGETFRLESRVYENGVRHFINGQALSFATSTGPSTELTGINDITQGFVGIHVDYAKVTIDNVKIEALTPESLAFEREQITVALGSSVAVPSVLEGLSDGGQVRRGIEEVSFLIEDASIVQVEQGQLVPLALGSTVLTAEANGSIAQLHINVVEKDGSEDGDKEEVLLYEDFSNVPDGQIPEGWETYIGVRGIEGEWYVQDGKLIGDHAGARTGRILFGDAEWQDYAVKVKLSFESWDDRARWAGIMFRTAEGGQDFYYQFALRPNGQYEQHQRKNRWEPGQKYTGSVSPLNLNETFELETRVFENTTRHYINGAQVFFSGDGIPAGSQILNMQNDRPAGKPGINVDYARIAVEEVKVTNLSVVELAFAEDSLQLTALEGPVELPAVNRILSDGSVFEAERDAYEVRIEDEAVLKLHEGKLWPLAAGTTNVVAKLGAHEATLRVNVQDGGLEAKIVQLYTDQEYLLFTLENEPVRLDVYGLFSDLSERDLTTEVSWTAEQPGVVELLENHYIQPVGLGYTKLQGQWQEQKIELPVRVNTVNEAKLWLEQDFAQIPDGQLPAGWVKQGGQAVVEQGRLKLQSTSSSVPTSVIIPLGIKAADYEFEADVSFQQALDPERWLSLMYRVHPETNTYYQFAARKNTSASSGLEFAYRNSYGSWDVLDKSFEHQPFAFNQTYKLKVKVTGNTVQQWVNDRLVIHSELAADTRPGDVGLQVNGVTAFFDQIKVYIEPDALPEAGDKRPIYPEDVHAGIIQAPTLAMYMNQEEWQKSKAYGDQSRVASGGQASEDIPATSVILPVYLKGGQLFVQVDQKQRKKDDPLLVEVLNQTKTKIPILEIKNPAIAKRFIELLQEKQERGERLTEVHILSDQLKVIQQIRDQEPTTRGIYAVKHSIKKKSQRLELALDLHQHGVRTVVLEGEHLTAEWMKDFQWRGLEVWARVDESKDVYRTVAQGVDGLLTRDAALAASALQKYPDQTWTKYPFLIAHRGMSAIAPENTMSAFRLAEEYGADYIELDILRSKDGHLVVIHDDDVERVSGVKGLVEEMTLAELKSLDVGQWFSPEFTGERIPTLEEVLQEFQGKDILFFLEPKGNNVEEQMVEMLEEYQMAHQVVVLSFSDEQLRLIRELDPRLPLVYLGRGAVPEERQTELAKYDVDYSAYLNAMYAPRHSIVYPELYKVARDRGMMLWPWTVNEYSQIYQFYQYGSRGVITDYAHQFEKQILRIEAEASDIRLKMGEELELQAIVHYRDGTSERIRPQLLVVEQEERLAVNENKLTGVHTGKALVLLQVSFEEGGLTFHRFSEPIEVTIIQ